MRGVVRAGEAAKASHPAASFFAGLWRRSDPVGVAAQRCCPVSLLGAGEVSAPCPLPLALKSRYLALPGPAVGVSGGCGLGCASAAQRRRGAAAAAGRAQRGLDLFLGQNRTHRGSDAA